PSNVMDLAIRKGTVVTTSGTFPADVGVAEGRIVQVGGDVPAAAREIDARDRLLLPGCVDIHTHLGLFRGEPPLDDFLHGTRAAAAGGVTTVCDFAHQEDGRPLLAALEAVKADPAAQHLVDSTFRVGLRAPSPGAVAELPQVAAAGAGLKLFMNAPRFDRMIGEYLRALVAAGRAGIITAIHAEDAAIISLRTERLLAEG